MCQGAVIAAPTFRVGAEAPSLKAGGGDGTYDGMEQHVAALEKSLDRFERKLDVLISDVADIRGQLKSMPSGIAFGALKGRVNSPLTTSQLLWTVVAVLAATGILKYFGY